MFHPIRSTLRKNLLLLFLSENIILAHVDVINQTFEAKRGVELGLPLMEL